mmetsp:Transcript_30495/g.98531  ORF Transcript_30495/g.98531 Transcript_30495/m.98531 type:complete len:111 (-) Transcript_30495:2529-2861(-)
MSMKYAAARRGGLESQCAHAVQRVETPYSLPRLPPEPSSLLLLPTLRLPLLQASRPLLEVLSFLRLISPQPEIELKHDPWPRLSVAHVATDESDESDPSRLKRFWIRSTS